MVQNDLMEPVIEPTEWCAPIGGTPKQGSDDIRICVDLSKLNKYIIHERFQSPTPQDVVADMTCSNATYFTEIDALNGYWQCLLDKDSQLLTTFIMLYGHYKFKRAPFGICSISEHYNQRLDEAFAGIARIRRIMDDVMAYDTTFDEHVTHVRMRTSNLGVVKPSFVDISSALVDIASALTLPRQTRSFRARLPSPTFDHSWVSPINSQTSARTSLEPLSL